MSNGLRKDTNIINRPCVVVLKTMFITNNDQFIHAYSVNPSKAFAIVSEKVLNNNLQKRNIHKLFEWVWIHVLSMSAVHNA